MKEYIEIENTSVLNFKENLKLTKNIDNLVLMEKPNKELVELRKEKNYKLYQMLINKYDFITFEIINTVYRLYPKLEIEPVKIFNNILNLGGIDINPIAKGYTSFELATNTVYPGGLKYFTMATNPYFKELVDKEICIIKIIGPWEINEKEELELFFHEERYLNKKNKIKTIFIYFDWDTKKKYKKTIYGDGYDFIVAEDPSDERIGDYIKNADILIIDKVSLLSKFECADDLIVLTHTMFLVEQFLLRAKKNADLVFMYTTPHILPHYQLYYYLYRNFTTMSYYISILSQFRDGIFIFKGFNNLNDNLLSDVIKKYTKIDNSHGHNLYLITDKNWCQQQKYKSSNPIDIFISSLYDEPFSDKFSNFMYKLKKYKKKHAALIVNKINFLKKQINFKNDKTYNYSKIKSIVYYNIDECINFLNEYNIQVNDVYSKNSVFTPEKTLNIIFPNIKKDLLKNLQFSRDSIYSVSSYDVAEKTSILIKKYFKNVRNVIDGTANIGGNTFNFSKNFDKIVANELSTTTFNNLKNNLDVLNLKNVKLYNYDIKKLFDDEKFFKDIKFDIENWCLYLDPPWTGVYYRLERTIDLFFGTTNVSDFIKKVNVKYICMKVPKNFNFSYLFDLFSNIKIFKVVYCYIVLIEREKFK